MISTSIVSAKELNVLFLGNSYTYVNDVPKMVQNLAHAAGHTLTYDQHTEGGWTLDKHWHSDITLNKIRQGGWDIVVIQGHSQETSEKQADICSNSYKYAKHLAEEVHKHNPGAKIQWYLTWGRPFGDSDRCSSIPKVCTYEGMQDSVTKTYTTYGCMFKPGQVAPVGEAFREFKAIYDDEFFTLYNTNGVSDHHAAPKGSYLSACVHFSTLFHDSSSGNSYHGNLNNQVAKKLQDVADKVVNRGGWEYPTSSDCNLTMCQNIV